MEFLKNIVTLIGGIGTVMGMIWGFSGFMKWTQSKKNGDESGEDKGLQGIILGGILAVVSVGMAAAINSQLDTINLFG